MNMVLIPVDHGTHNVFQQAFFNQSLLLVSNLPYAWFETYLQCETYSWHHQHHQCSCCNVNQRGGVKIYGVMVYQEEYLQRQQKSLADI